MKIYLSIVVLAVSLLYVENALQKNPDEDRDTCELVVARGFGCDVHFVRTYQDYIIELHRIIHPDNDHPNEANLTPVILQPGLVGTSNNFVLASDVVTLDPNITGQNMGFELAKQGYDVWLSNNRGNEYGLHHETLDSKDKKFWEFTFDEIAHFDTPAIIDYVRNVTGYSKVGFVGHSQGTSVMFAQLSNSTHYNEIVEPFIAISPITRIGAAKTIFRLLLAALRPLLSIDGSMFDNPILSRTAEFFCRLTVPRIACETAMGLISGPNPSQLNSSRVSVYVAKMGSSTSARNLLHFHQMFTTNEFKRFDYGVRKNNEIYGQKKAPVYNLSQITHKAMHVIYGLNDYYVPVEGVEALKEELPDETEFYQVSDPKSNHVDPLIGIDIAVEVNQKVIEILNHYRN